MNRMVRAYMHEEELRARHQATLLRLREDALQEKTQAHLEWLKIKKKALQKKGGDDKMPPLARMERGLLKKYKQEQVSEWKYPLIVEIWVSQLITLVRIGASNQNVSKISFEVQIVYHGDIYPLIVETFGEYHILRTCDCRV